MRYFLLVAISMTFGCGMSRAGMAAPPVSGAAADPPSRVARLSYLRGAVSMRPAGTAEWIPGELNRPLTTGDAVWTEPDGRAELHLGTASVRLNGRTDAGLLEVSSGRAQFRVGEGSIAVHLRELEENEQMEIDTPHAAISLLRAGHYRVTVGPGGAWTEVVARSGSAAIAGDGFSVVLRGGQQARIPGPGGPSYEVTQAPARDSFDVFCDERDAREDRALARRHVSAGVIGYEDLEEHGVWEPDPMWGPVWVPRVAVGWAPYRFGHWVWIEPWGWTWIESAPWGFAPFHYGRWLVIRSRWCWIPGPFHRRPVWAPALVVFVGGGNLRFHFEIAGGFGVAWFPLGPREIWLPPYRASRGYVTHLNVTNTRVADERRIASMDMSRQRYANQAAEGAITAMPRDPFLRGEPAERHTTRVDPARIRTGGSAPPFAPVPESLGRRGDRTVARPPAATEKRPVVVQRTPPPPTVPFEQRRRELEPSMGRVPAPSRAEAPPVRTPEYRPVPRAAPAPTPRTEPAPAPRSAPAPETRRPATPRQDRQWEQRTQRDEQRRQETIQRERRRESGTQRKRD